jgi:cysteine desulfurase
MARAVAWCAPARLLSAAASSGMEMARIYLDYAATTPLRPEAARAAAALSAAGNPSSLHAEGRAARAAVDEARELLARVLGCAPREVVFTAGGTDAAALAVLGAARAAGDGGHVVVSAIEHRAVLHAAQALEAEGRRVTRVPVGTDGRIDVREFAAALTRGTVLASVMLGNNEIGTLQPVAELAALARERGILFHTDAVQAAGWLALDVDALGVDLLSLSAHKFHGPKGVGALYVRRGAAVLPLAGGGGQESGLRGGTENVAGIAAMAAALGAAEAERPEAAPRVAALRDRLQAGLVAAIPDVVVNGAAAPRLPGILSLAFGDVPSDALLMRLDLEGIAASAGSACAAGSLEPSHVTAALGLPERFRRGTVRFSLGRATTEAEIDEVIARLPGLLADIRMPLTV